MAITQTNEDPETQTKEGNVLFKDAFSTFFINGY